MLKLNELICTEYLNWICITHQASKSDQVCTCSCHAKHIPQDDLNIVCKSKKDSKSRGGAWFSRHAQKQTQVMSRHLNIHCAHLYRTPYDPSTKCSSVCPSDGLGLSVLEPMQHVSAHKANTAPTCSRVQLLLLEYRIA